MGSVMEAASAVHPAHSQSGQLVAAARARLDQELAQLPPLGSTAFGHALQDNGEMGTVSPGALVHILRQAVSQGDQTASRELFILILRRVAATNAALARRTVQRVWSVPAEVRRTIEEDLQQELTLHLWEQLALHAFETWEIFFHRALDYALATSYLVRNGYWHDP
jgi:hypothetical protein